MDALILIGLGALGVLLVGRYLYRAVVKGETECCSGCSCSQNCGACCPGMPLKMDMEAREERS